MKGVRSYIKIFNIALFLVFASKTFAQDYQITGNGDQSVMACTSGKVYAWGKNVDGMLGVGNTTESIRIPTEVKIPSEAGKINHVDGSSGAFLLAINCAGEVWIWGDNQYGQCGNSSHTENPITTPVYLMCGETSSNTTAKISGIKAISGGSSTGYAITSDNRLIAWGNGADGRLGNGTTATTKLPVYVRDKNGNILENVIMVDGGDNTCYCLVDDDGDGIGTVYSFGQVQTNMLGRSTSATNTYALPVEKEDGTPLNNITTIAAGDVHGIAIDADGYVWTWGNNWGGSSYGNNYAVKMEGGETGETYLQAKSIAGGNGFNMAVTLDGNVVTWGCNGSIDHSGGNLGNGKSENSASPVYVLDNLTHDPLTNVVTVARGNAWGFARKADNSIWVWGSNQYGVLGIGSTVTRQEYAVELDLSAIDCGLPDMPPTIALPQDFTACISDGWSYIIDSGFKNKKNSSGNYIYQFTWYKGAATTANIITGETGETLTVTEPGTYSLKISYVGDNYDVCGGNPDDAIGSITITAYEPEFSVPTDIEFCGDSVEVYVNGHGIYDLYTNYTGGSFLATVNGGEKIKIPISKLTEKSGDNYTLYVAETSSAAGLVNPIDTNQIGGDYETQYNDRHVVAITVSENVVLDTVSIFCTGLWNASATIDINVGLYTGTPPLSSLTKVQESSTISTTVYGSPHYDYKIVGQEVKIPLGFSLTPGKYYLALSTLSTSQTWISRSETGAYPYVDNANGETVKMVSYLAYAAEQTVEPPFYNLQFHSTPKYCKRMAMTVTAKCSCNDPSEVSFVDAPTYLCGTETTTLVTNNQADATTFDFTWFSGSEAKGTPLQGPDGGENSSLANVSAGTYTVLVKDVSSESCQTTKTITIDSKSVPSATISTDSEFCEGTTITPTEYTFEGTAPFSFKYALNGTETEKTKYTTKSFTPEAPSTSGTYKYTITELKDAYCEASTTDLAKLSSTITINSKPEITATVGTDENNSCEGGSLTVSATTITGASYAWTSTSKTAFSATTASKLVSATTTVNNSGTYNVIATDGNGCKDTAEIVVTIYPNPAISDATVSNTEICSGNEITFSATVSNTDAGGTYAWSGTKTGSNATLAITESVSTTTTLKEKLTYTTSNGCSATSEEISATIYPIPAKVSTEDLTFSACVGDDAIKLADKVSATSGCTLQWYNASKTALTSAPTIATTSAIVSGEIYYVSQRANNCESELTKITVIVNDGLTPIIKAEPNGACVGTDIVFSLDDTYATQKWSLASKTTPTVTLETDNITENSYKITVDVTNANGCKGSGELTVPIYAIPTATITATPNAICNLQSTDITATVSETGGTGEWTNATESTETSATFTATTAGNSKVSYVYTSTHNCVSKSAETTITIYDIPSTPTVSAVSYCVDDIASAVTATATGTLNWYDAKKTALATTPTPSTATAQTISYYVSQTENGCESDVAQLDVTIHALPTPVISADNDAICEGSTISLSLDKTYKAQTWSCLPTNTLNSVTLASPTLQASATANTYTIGVIVTDENGCKNATEVTKSLLVNPIPTVTLSELTNQCVSSSEQQTITATVSPTGTTGVGTWSSPAVKATETTATFTPSIAKAGVYTITYDFTSAANCVAKQVSKSVEVYELPAITITPSATFLCESGDNSGDVTMKMTGKYNTTGTETPTFSYSSTTLSGVNTTTGTFNSVGQTAGNHTISLVYTDANGCEGKAETNVSINARPIADISANPTEICDYAQPITLIAKINNVETTEGTFAGNGVSNKTFTPSTLIKGTNTITYNYTDSNGCTAEEVSMTMTVHHTETPTVQSTSASKLDVTNQASVPFITATGDDIKWYLTNDTTTAVKATGSNYTETFVDADSDGKMDVGTYTAYATQTQNGCQSAPAEATLTITDCAAKAPTGNAYHTCVNDENDVTISAISNQTSEANFCWFTDRNDVPTGTISSLADAQATAKGSGETYVVSKSLFTKDKTITIYVSEYYETDHCFSAATPITIAVHTRPVPTITNPGNICSSTNEITINYAPTTSGSVVSTLSAEQGTITNNKWSIYYDDTKTGITTTKITLTTVETWETKECASTTSEDFAVTHVLAPTGTGIGTTQIWSASKVDAIPNMVIDYANDLSATLSIKDETNTEIATESPVIMTSHISAMGDYQYTVTQTLQGCSASAISNWSIVECPTPAPNPQSVEICAGESLPTLNANGTGTAFQWYDEKNTLLSETTANLDVASLSSYSSSQDMTTTTYTFAVQQDGDDGAGGRCFGPTATVAVTIHALPQIVLNSIPTLCYDGNEFEVIATVDGNRATNGTWTIDNATDGVSTSGIITPNFKNNSSDGDFELKYAYTDAITTCSNSAKELFHVEFVETPNPINFNGIITDPKTVAVSVSNSDKETGATFNWYENKNDTNILSSLETFETSDNPTTVISKSYYVEKQIGSCVSERAEATVTIVDCPFGKPNVNGQTVCVNSSLDDIIASTTETSSPTWNWYDKEGTKLSNSSSTFTHGVSTATAGTTKFYVSYSALESSSNTECESAKAEVELVVLPLPEITFSENNPNKLCTTDEATTFFTKVNYHDNGIGSGSWSVIENSTAITSNGIFNPTCNGDVTNTYTIQYDYTDGFGCQNSAQTSVLVQFAPQPTLSNHFSMTTENKDAVLQASDLEVGGTISWYATKDATNILSSANPFSTGDKGTIATEKSYFATQTINGCESKRVETTVKIVDCPVPAPTTISATMCNYDETPEIKASLGTWTDGTRPSGSAEIFRLYDENGNKITENTSGSFVPTIDKSSTQTYTFYITEWNENTQPIGCESPKSIVTLTVKKTPSAKIIADRETVCEAPIDKNPTMTATGYSGSGEYLWFEENPNYPTMDVSSNGTTATFIPQTNTIGENTVWLSILENDCYSEPVTKSFTIKAIPSAPQTTANEVCEGQANVAISAATTDGFISWYSDINATRVLRTNTSSYIPTESKSGTYKYYATQTVDGCQSETSEVLYEIKANPSMPVITYNTYNICVYDNAPILTAQGENIAWYSADKVTLLVNGDSYETTDMTVGRHTFYATQTINGCESPMTDITYYVNPKPTAPITTSKTMCEGDEVIPTLTTNLATDNWYADKNASSFLQSGAQFTPETVGSEDLTYYITREQNGCNSDTVSVTLHVIQQPTFAIDTNHITACYSDDVVTLNAKNLDEDYHTNSEIDGYIRWYFNKSTVEGDSYTPEALQVGTNTIYAQYFVTREGTTCASKQESMTYEIHGAPRAPILMNTPICLGEYLKNGESASIPIFASNTIVTWSSPVIDNGAIHESKKISIPNSYMEILGAGYIPVTVTTMDPDAMSCTTSIVDSVKLADIPDATIVGADHVCEGAVSELYYIQNPKQTSSYDWKLTGGNQIYTKSSSSLNTRYIDWTHHTIDTIMVCVTSEDMCLAFDTLVVRVAPKPEAKFTWTLPGASNIIEITNSSIQDSLWYQNEENELVGEEIPYTMYWNYGHQGESETIVDAEIPYEERNYPITEGEYTYGYNCPILTVVNDYGCSANYTECVFVNITTSLFVPNAFSPTNPAHSVRTFQPKGFNLKTCEISVYDKWGNLVWFSDEVENGMFVGKWDGTNNGKMMKSDVYIWKMEATFLDGQVWEGFDDGNGKKSKFGSVTLIR